MKKLICVLLLLPLLAMTASAAFAANMRETAVAYMEIKFECGCTRGGVGTMIARNGLVTAAHNLVCSKHSKKLKSCNFYFGRTSGGKNHYKYTGKFTYYWFEDFKDGYKSRNDIGYVVFPKDIGTTTGWYAWSCERDKDLKGAYCYVKGYKNKKPTSDWGKFSVVNNAQISWTRASSFEDSDEGGPVYYDNSNLEFPVLVAVYTSFNGSTAYARRMTDNVYEDMKKNGVKFSPKN